MTPEDFFSPLLRAKFCHARFRRDVFRRTGWFPVHAFDNKNSRSLRVRCSKGASSYGVHVLRALVRGITTRGCVPVEAPDVVAWIPDCAGGYPEVFSYDEGVADA